MVRANGDLVVGTQMAGSFVSHDQGDTWEALTTPPHINCLVENSAGEVWACTQNFGTMQVPSDGAGIMKTTDMVAWTPVLKFQNIAAPVTCPAGTPQHDLCTVDWCDGLKQQLGLTSTAVDCNAAGDGPPQVDSGLIGSPPSDRGCCDTGRGGPAALAFGAVVGAILLRRRRRS